MGGIVRIMETGRDQHPADEKENTDGDSPAETETDEPVERFAETVGTVQGKSVTENHHDGGDETDEIEIVLSFAQNAVQVRTPVQAEHIHDIFHESNPVMGRSSAADSASNRLPSMDGTNRITENPFIIKITEGPRLRGIPGFTPSGNCG
jgi:hypothetical protein